MALRQVLSVTKPRSFPTWKQWKQLPSILTPDEKRLSSLVSLVFFLSLLVLGITYISAHRIEIPTTGGEFTEALIGNPRFINPLYASANDADQDLTSLVFSGLTKWDPKNGYQNDLAESIQTSEDLLRYTVKIKSDAKFSNGERVRARDVVFTYSAVQDPAYHSTLFSFFQNTKIEQVDDQTILFTLKTPDLSFIHKLTVGILPEDLWADVTPQNASLAALNLQPIGSGPYVFHEFTKDKKGTIKTYTLKRNTHYYSGEPKIDKITFKFYPDETSALGALTNKNTEGISFVESEHRDTLENNYMTNLYEASLPRATMLFFNQQNDLLKNPVVRLSLAQAIDKQKIVSETLSSHATLLHGPLFSETPSFDASYQGISFDPSSAATALDAAQFQKPAGAIVRKIPSKSEETEQKDLSFTLTTLNTEEFLRVAEEIKNELSLLGTSITVKGVTANELKNDVLPNQNFELLLSAHYGASDPDPYYFWHSSQKERGNISRYQNTEADALLEKARQAKTESEKTEAHRQFQAILVKDVPAVFLYQSNYLFAESKKIHLDPPSHIRIPSDRFANITDWYIKTKQTLK